MATKTTPSPVVTENVALDSFVVAEEAVRTYSRNNPNVMAECQKYLTEIRALEAQGKISKKDTARILDAVVFAAEKHQNQTRKNAEKTPYIIHPIIVSYTLATIANVYNADVLIAALLHDTVEDTDATFEEIQDRFGTTVVGFVREVTDDKTLPKEQRKKLQIENASHKSPGAALIKLSDKLSNLRDMSTNPPPNWSEERVHEYFLWAQKVVHYLPVVQPDLKQRVDDVIAEYLARHEC